MKNFKLLLATTAVLSMGAMVANAANTTLASGTIDAEITLEAVPTIAGLTPLNFGRIKPVESDSLALVTVTITPDGERIVSVGTALDNTFARGSFTITGANIIKNQRFQVIFGDIVMEETGDPGLCGLRVEDIHSNVQNDIIDTSEGYIDGTYYFGGTVNEDGVNYLGGQSMHCAGSGTVTLVLLDE